MAAALGAARRALLRCSAASSASTASMERFLSSHSISSSVSSRFSRRVLPSSMSRLPVELSFVQSLLPLHSVTASALLISMLSVKPGSWAWLSEGFATPL
ncbi:hypothetical protein HPP92_004502 [Vanilla planifolia]|uniref:Protein NUCLEAR FUSION DEFECTIVE 6, chloroplastic/mitochondrial n=1 Tax=Vanilla planifolia TaxID=51239 RepID=A0A835VDP3_VANPL|nr:hypothetical protein HPP92_004502 [Vanilla planifolia]